MNDLRRIKMAFDKISNAVGNDKLPVIREVCKDEIVFVALVQQLNPFEVFGIGKKSILAKLSGEPSVGHESLLELCSDLSSKKGVSNQDIINVQAYLDTIDEPYLRQFAEDYLTKSITIGATGKTVNKALGVRAVPLFECMLANKYFEHQNAVEGKQFAITEKLDGIRCIAMVYRNRKPVLYTRQGQVIEGLIDIEAELTNLAKDHSFNTLMLDGELLIDDRDRFESKEQYKQTTKIVRKNGEKHGVTYHVFDCVKNSNCMMPYSSRRAILSYYLSSTVQKHIRLVPVAYEGEDQNQIIYHLNKQRELGHEGVMINILDAPYEYKRTSNLLKCKVMQDVDLEIVGFQEGNGKYSGTLGALIVDYKGSDVGVGSGLSNADRDEIWYNRGKYLGRIATIQYFEETQDADGKPSIRFPVFKEIREEGKEISYN